MAAMSDFLRNKILDCVLRAVPYNPPAQVWIALYTSDPTSSDVGAEASAAGTGYARRQITFSASSAGRAAQATLITFPQAAQNWGTITHFGIRDAANTGNLLLFAPLGVPKAVIAGETPQMAIGAVVATLS